MHNYLNAVSTLIPPEGSPRRLKGYATYSFAHGNTFVIVLDANTADDQKRCWQGPKPRTSRSERGFRIRTTRLG